MTDSAAAPLSAFSQLDSAPNTPSAAWHTWVENSACAFTAFADASRSVPSGPYDLPGVQLGDVAFCDQVGIMPAPAAEGSGLRDSPYFPPWSVVVAVPRNAFSSYLWFPIVVPSVLTLLVVLSTWLIVAQLKQKLFTHCAASIRDACGGAKKRGSGGGTANHKDYLVNGKSKKKKKKQKGGPQAGHAWTTALLDRMVQELTADDDADGAAAAHNEHDGPHRVARVAEADAPLSRPRRMSMLEQHPNISRKAHVTVSKSGTARYKSLTPPA